MPNYIDIFDEAIKSKQKATKKIYNSVFKRKSDREKNAELLNEICEQIDVCEAMCCPIPMEKIEEWIKSGSIKKVRLEAYRIKFA